MIDKSALVLFSGGQDSTVSLLWACKNFEHVETVGFNYNQRHLSESESEKNNFTALDLKTLNGYYPYFYQIGGSILVRNFKALILKKEHIDKIDKVLNKSDYLHYDYTII